MYCKFDSPNAAGKLSKYGVFSGPYFPVFRLNTEIYLRIQSEYRNIRTRKNSVFGHFPRSVKVYCDTCFSLTCFKESSPFILIRYSSRAWDRTWGRTWGPSNQMSNQRWNLRSNLRSNRRPNLRPNLRST